LTTILIIFLKFSAV